MEIIKPVTEEDPDPYKQRLDRLREKSKELQMGWCDNKKDLVKQLAEKFLTNTTKVLLVNFGFQLGPQLYIQLVYGATLPVLYTSKVLILNQKSPFYRDCNFGLVWPLKI